MDKDTKPLVSVIIPVYNGEKYIRDAIDSALDQTYPNIEILVVDDGSKDNTPNILDEYASQQRVIVLSHKNYQNRGVSLSRKLGIDHARGKYIAFLDADDMFLPEKIFKQVEALERNLDVVLCHTDVYVYSEVNTYPKLLDNIFKLDTSEYKYWHSQEPYFLVECHICNPTVVIKSEILKNLPFYSKQYFRVEDWLMWILIAERGCFLYLPEKLTYYRYHPSSYTAKTHSNPLIWQYKKIELSVCLLSRLRNKYIRSKAVNLLQDTLIWLIIEFSNNGVNNKKQTFVQISKTLGELFRDDLDVSAISSHSRYRSLLHNLTAKDLAKEFSLFEIVKALGFRLAYRLRLTK